MRKILGFIKQNILLIIFTLIESFLQVYGYLLTINKSLVFFNIKYFFVSIIVFIFLLIVNYFYFKMLAITYQHNNKYNFSKKNFLRTWFLIFIMWIPVLLAYYPTIWTYDVKWQIPHIMNKNFTTFQPLIHTLFLELFLIIGKKIYSYELGMLMLSIIQMLIMSCIFAYVIEKMKTKINNKKIINIFMIGMIIYYGLIPFNSIMAISMTKDVLFSGLILLIIIYLYDYLDGEKFTKKKKFLFISFLVLALLIKNNFLYVFIVFMIISVVMLKDIKKKQILNLSLITLGFYYAITLFIVFIFHPEKGYRFEGYSIPAQNLIYSVIKHPEIDVNKDELLFDFIPRKCFPKDLSKIYNKNRTDIIKDDFIYCLNNDFDDYKLLKQWVYYGKKYPLDYIDSWSNLTIGSWYLFDESHANTYDVKYLQGYLPSGFLAINDFMKQEPKSKNQWLKNKLELVATENIQYADNSLLRFLFVPATYILSFFLMVVYIIQNKVQNQLLPLIILITLFSSILFGPVIIVRYIYPFMITVPIITIRIITQQKSAN